MSELIEKMELKIDQDGDVIPPESFSGNGKKNYIAHIIARDPKYTWKRQWIQRSFRLNKGMRYNKEGFVIGEIYEFHASFLPTPVEESEMKQDGSFDIEHWKRDKMNRVNSLYNGFWIVKDITETEVMCERAYPGDMDRIFPKLGHEDEYQSSIEDFFFNTSGDEHIL